MSDERQGSVAEQGGPLDPWPMQWTGISADPRSARAAVSCRWRRQWMDVSSRFKRPCTNCSYRRAATSSSRTKVVTRGWAKS